MSMAWGVGAGESVGVAPQAQYYTPRLQSEATRVDALSAAASFAAIAAITSSSLRTLFRRRMRKQDFFGVRINPEKRKQLHETTATVRPAAVFVNNGAKLLEFFPDVAICVDHGSVKHHVRAPSPVRMGDVPLMLLDFVRPSGSPTACKG